MSERQIVQTESGEIEVMVRGAGRTVVLVPSLGRGADDFDDLAARVAAAGYRVLAPNPRGIGGSTGPIDGLTMEQLSDDVMAVVRALGSTPATLVGHAFGNRVVRLVASREPDAVDRVALLAAGGRVPPAPEVGAALLAVFDPALSDEAHLGAVRLAFFADGNDPAVWSEGWYPAVAAAQMGAQRQMDVDTWWRAGRAQVLVVQPAEDRLAVAANALDVCEQLGSRASMVTIERAGHALLPEQPEAVAEALIAWLRG